MTDIQLEQVLPGDIERRSFEIIQEELSLQGIHLEPENEMVIKRAIHTTADFDYAQNLVFSGQAVKKGTEALKAGAVIVTDTNMGLSGINKKRLSALGGEAFCFMADEDVALQAKEQALRQERETLLAGEERSMSHGTDTAAGDPSDLD